MSEMPALNDEQVATLVRDALLNARIHDEVTLSWATSETVARLRRTVAIELARRAHEVAKSIREVPKPKKKKDQPRIVRAKNCPRCDQRVRGDAWKCPRCLNAIT